MLTRPTKQDNFTYKGDKVIYRIISYYYCVNTLCVSTACGLWFFWQSNIYYILQF
jgi:hypothetical protein